MERNIEYCSPYTRIVVTVISESCLASSGNIGLGENGDGIHVGETDW